ncbi:hypothetical protein BJ742DRAFT_102395 [Cladochytrium replicatum]|nr:hypothetical protein BJ742DRAFT_102395 [Cladochytrium replicatum]
MVKRNSESNGPIGTTQKTADEKLMQRPRPYQIELFEEAMKRNIIAYLDTGSGKTLVSVLLIQQYAEPLLEVSRPEIIRLVNEARKKSRISKSSDTSNLPQKFDHDEMDDIAEATNMDYAEGTDDINEGGTEINSNRLSQQLMWRQEQIDTLMLPKQPRKVVFLVPTVPLVAQQAEKIRSNTDLSIGEYSRDDSASVTYWDAIGWYHEMSMRQVLVFTPQIFLNVLRHGFMSLSRDVSLIVVDECHHTAKNHAYNVIFREFYHSIQAGDSRPKVFGMTASPIHQKTTTHGASLEKLLELQNNLGCTVMTIANRNSLRGYVPQATEMLVEYESSPVGSDFDESTATPSERFYNYHITELTILLDQFTRLRLSDRAQKVKRTITLAKQLKQDLGYWCAGRAAESFLYGFRPRSNYISRKRNFDSLETGKDANGISNPQKKRAVGEDREVVPVEETNEQLIDSKVEPRKEATSSLHAKEAPNDEKFINSAQNLPKLPDASEITPHDISPKVHAVLRLLAERAVAAVKSDRGPKSFRAMVFVEKRSTAKALCELITLVVPARFPIITCGYVTGHGSTTHRFSNDKESGMNMNSATQKRIFERFRQGDMNTVVVTRVAEEGVDIPACRLVIIFDLFRSNTGYVQSRGRARDIDGSEYIVMVMRNDMHALQYLAKAKMAELLTRSIAKEVSREGLVAGEGSESSSGVGTNQVVRDEDDDELAELLVGSQDEPITTLAGAKVTSASAMQLLQHFCFARLRGRKVEDASPRFRVILEPNLSAAALWKLYRVAWRNQDNRLRQMSELRAKDLGIELPNIALRSDDTGESESNEFNGQIPFGFAFEVLLPNEVILVNSRMPSEWLCEPGSGQNHPRFIGSVRITKKLAMQSAALEACRQLYLLGALNERLLPTLHVRNDASLVNALGGSRVRGAFSLRSVLSQSLNDAGRRKDKKELQLLQKFANEDLFIRSGAVLEAVKNGAALGTISVDTLDDAVLGEYRRELPKAFTYDEKWMKIVYDQETKGAGIVQSFIPALEYGSEEEKDGADTAGSQGYANVSKSSVQNFIPPAFEFFVTIITFGPQLELYTRSCDPPVSATHNLVYGPKFPYVDSPYTNHYYYYPNPNCYALSPKEPRRSIALMTLRPIPTRSIPEFCVWLGGESPCKVKLLPWSPDEREGSRRSEASADNLDDTEQESLNDVEAENSMGYKSVMFSSKELAKIKPFQQRFWDLVLRRPLKGQNLSAKVPNETGNNDTTRETRNHESTPEAEPDPRMYMVLPVFGNPLPPDTRSRRLSYSDSVPHLPTLKLGDDSSGTYLPKLSELPDPPACNWELDWPLVDRVISEKTCTLYEWIRQIGEIAGDLVERQTNRQKGKAKDSFIEREAFDPSEEQMMKVDDGLEDLDFDLEIEQEEDENLNEPTTQISEVPPEVGFGDDDDEDYLDQIMFDETGIQEESTIAMEDELSSDAENPEPSYSTKNDKRKRRKVDIGGIERKPFCSAEESSVRSTQSPTTTYKIPSFDMLYERVLNSSGIKAEPARFSKAVFQKVNEVLAQTVVQTPHNNIKYFVRQITPDITSNNEFNAPRFAKSSAAGTGNAQTTYKSYVERLGYTVEHPDSPMVEAHHATHPRNMLRPWKYSNRQDLSDEPPDNRSNSGSNVLLVPDVCRVIPFPSEFFRLALGVFPSVLHKVEQFMLVDEFRRKIRLPMVTNRTLYSAFCAPSAHEPGNCNYERLETLGDAFLKYACSADLFQRNDDLSEGGLSVRRAKCVSNRNLYRKAKKLSLGGLLIVSPFHPRSWAPPGCLPPLVASGLAGYNRKGAVSELEDEENGWGNGSKDLFGPFSWHRSKKGAWWRLVSLKMMADFVEALVEITQ